MTADWAQLPDVSRRVSNRIINEVKGANRVVYDNSSKPGTPMGVVSIGAIDLHYKSFIPRFLRKLGSLPLPQI